MNKIYSRTRHCKTHTFISIASFSSTCKHVEHKRRNVCRSSFRSTSKIRSFTEIMLFSQFEEYFEIFSGKTVLPLILEGTGIAPELEFKPNSLVYRLNTKANKVAECTLEIANKCSADVTINFERALELEGYIITEKVQKEKPESQPQKKEVEKKSKKKAGKDKKSDKKSKKSTKSKKAAPPPKFSDTLTEAEESSINKSFKIREGESFFDILNIDANQVNVPGNSTKLIKLGFGTNEALLKRKKEMKEKKKGGKREKVAKDKGSSGKSKESKKGADVTYYLAKYNIKIRNSFVKDVILVCHFK